MSGITIGLLLIGAIIVAAVLFGLWVIAMVLKFIGRGIAAMFGFGRPMEPLTRPSYPCPRSACRAVNPASARFCRRCGQELLKRQLARQAAMW